MSDEANTASNAVSESAPVNDAAPAQTEQPVEKVQEEKPASSAREAVERAIAKVRAQPDESKETEKPSRVRDEATGKFAKADAKPEAKQPVQQQAVDPASTLKAPPRFAKAAQDAWAQTPEPVRQEVERALNELTQGHQKYKESAEAFEPIRKFHNMAMQSGTTLEKALTAFVGIETAWRQNPAQGFVAVCQNMGVDTRQMLQAVAQGLQGQPTQVQSSQEVLALRQQLAQFEQKFGTLEKTFTETQQQTKQHDAEKTVEAFAKDHTHFDEVADSIADMLDTGFAKDLPDAYAKAIRLNPEVLAKIEQEKNTAKPDPAHTREKAAKSITGSPSSGSTPEARKPAGSSREAVSNAFAQLGIR